MISKAAKHAEGYNRLLVDGKLVLEHRYVVEQHIGRPLASCEVIHHINGIRDDNRLENLQITTQSEHSKIHGADRQRELVELICPWCKSSFLKEARKVRYAAKIGTKHIFCSKSCNGKMNKIRQASVF